jgi:Zn-finger nucleic acid-binding protein
MKCPRDNNVLTELNKNGLRLHVCDRCNGILIYKGDTQKIDKNDLRNIPQFEIPKKEKIKIIEGTAVSPITGEFMKVIDYGGLKIDLCVSSNHIWLDSGELDTSFRKHLKFKKKSLGQSSDLMKFLVLDSVIEATF